MTSVEMLKKVWDVLKDSIPFGLSLDRFAKNFGIRGVIGLLFGFGGALLLNAFGILPFSRVDKTFVQRALGSDPRNGVPLAEVFDSKSKADRKNSSLFKSAQDSICIVTVHGGSWLHDLEVEPNFSDALKRGVRIKLCLVDTNSQAFHLLDLSRSVGLEWEFGKERLDVSTFRERLGGYRKLQADSVMGKNLSISAYSAYPWIRFTIYDGREATFVLTPFLNPGIEATKYYTNNPWLIRCLEGIFKEFESSSRHF